MSGRSESPPFSVRGRSLSTPFVNPVRHIYTNFIFEYPRGYNSTGIAGSDIHYRTVATMLLLTFLLKCCVMTQQEGTLQDVYTFAGTDQCQLPEYGPYSYIGKSIY